jgi:solute carrier family 13 (sodium-dependent dicarboxylate transporter), member 2/3/5
VEGVEEYVAEERRKLGPLSRGEKNTLLVPAFALIGWFLPGIVGVFAGDDSDAYVQVGEASNKGTVALIAVALLFLLPVNWKERRFTISWNQAARIDRGTVLLFGGGIVLGAMLSETGLAEQIGTSISDALGVSTIFGITVVIVVIAILISETTSNTASAAIVVPIAISIAASADLNPTIPALAAIFAANYGFMLPVSTPPNAIVYSSGLLPITRMIKAGFVFDIIGAVLCIAGVTVMANLVGLA